MTTSHDLLHPQIAALRPPRQWQRHPEYRLIPADEFGGPQLVGEGPFEIFELPAPLVPMIVASDVSTDEHTLELCRSIGHMGISKSDLTSPVTLTKAKHLAEDTTAYAEPLEDFRAAVAGVTALTHLERFVAGDIDGDTLAASWPQSSPWPLPETLGAASETLAEELRRGLLGLTIGLRSAAKDNSDVVSITLEGRIGIYSICILELATALMESQPFRACGRAPCGKLFRAGGVSGPGKRRGDSRYCSEACRAAEASRRYRARTA